MALLQGAPSGTTRYGRHPSPSPKSPSLLHQARNPPSLTVMTAEPLLELRLGVRSGTGIHICAYGIYHLCLVFFVSRFSHFVKRLFGTFPLSLCAVDTQQLCLPWEYNACMTRQTLIPLHERFCFVSAVNQVFAVGLRMFFCFTT